MKRAELGAAVAGTWYPERPEALRELVDRLLAEAPRPPEEPPLALITPHAGLRYSGAVAAAAFASLRSPPDRWNDGRSTVATMNAA